MPKILEDVWRIAGGSVIIVGGGNGWDRCPSRLEFQTAQPPMTPISLDKSDVDGVTLLRLRGSLSQPGVQEIQAAFSEAALASPRLVVDLTGVDVINTPGIGMILAAARAKKDAGGKMAVAGANAMVLRSLRMCRLDRVLTIVGEVTEAMEQVKV